MGSCNIAAAAAVDVAAGILSPVRNSISLARYESSSISSTKDCLEVTGEGLDLSGL